MFGKRLFGLSLLLVLVTGLLFNVDVPARAQDDEPDEDAVELVVGFYGEVESLDGDIIIGGVTVAPASAFNPSGLAVGDCVFITGTYLTSETLQAISLEISADPAACAARGTDR